MLPCPLCAHRWSLIGLVHLESLGVDHREQLVCQVPLTWPREPSRYDELLAHSLCQQGSEADSYVLLNPRTPGFRLDDISLTRKDFGQQHALEF